MPTITKATVTFVMPKGDDRDESTGISVRVFKADGSTIVWNDNVAPGRSFPDPGIYGAYDLAIADTNTSPAEFSGGTSTLRVFIDITAFDTWTTKVLISLTWSDGTSRTCESDTVTVDYKAPTVTWSNSQVASRN